MSSPNYRVGLVTTIETNLGDDFIRVGVLHILKEILGNTTIDPLCVNKHLPHTVFPPSHPVYRVLEKPLFRHSTLRRGRRLIEQTLSLAGPSRFETCDLVIQCGTPILWRGCRNSEWAGLIWRDVIARLAKKRKLILNIGGGSCYPWERRPISLFDDPDASFVRHMLDSCNLTTVRDELAKKLLSSLGYSVHQLICPALLAGQVYSEIRRPTDKILINYMYGGGHYDWGQGIDGGLWQSYTNVLITTLRQRGWKPVMLAHSMNELKMFERLWPDIPRTFPIDPKSYFDMIADAAFGVFNRMHASVAAAGLGVPSVAIGTDSRNLMVDSIGLPTLYVKEATVDTMLALVDYLVGQREEFSSRLTSLRDETFRAYVDLLRPALESIQ